MKEANQRVYTVILGGGRGSRLHPLTRHRAKPAVPLGGKYRLIDIPISNAINSGFRSIAVLTQFNSASLNAHISQAYPFDHFSRGAVEVFAAQQTEEGGEWFEGTADAVRKLLRRLGNRECEHVLILSGDHLYRMDYRELYETHLTNGAEVTVSVLPVPRKELSGFGVLSTDDDGRIVSFKEKPKDEEDLSSHAPPSALRERMRLQPDDFLASMGVYIFRMETLMEALADPQNLDFGKDILPRMISTHRVFSHVFTGYWRDIGTISSFYEANIALTDEDPPFRFYTPDAPIYTRPRFLPGTKILDARVSHSIVADGSLLMGAEIDHCVIGIRARIQRGANLKDTVMMGADFYEEDGLRAANMAKGLDAAGIGPDCIVERAIIDKNARIGARCVIKGDPSRPDQDGEGWAVRDGVVIVGKDVRLPAGTVI